MNNFSGDAQEIDLMSSMFQNMFPSLNVTKVKINTVRRCVLLHYDPESGTIEFRHYTIKVVPTGVSRGIKKLVQGKVPNLSRFEDMSEFLGSKTGGGMSDSEAEEDENSKVGKMDLIEAWNEPIDLSFRLNYLKMWHLEVMFHLSNPPFVLSSLDLA